MLAKLGKKEFGKCELEINFFSLPFRFWGSLLLLDSSVSVSVPVFLGHYYNYIKIK